MTDTYSGYCELQHGGSVKACGCRVKPWSRFHGGGWLNCPPKQPTVAEPTRPSPIAGSAAAAVAERPKARVRAMGFTGDLCDTCGSFAVVRNGTCTLCTDCGATSGCS